MPSRAILKRLKKHQLVELCQKHGLDTDGIKNDLLERLCAVEEIINSDDTSILVDESSQNGSGSNSNTAMFNMMAKMMEVQNTTMRQLAEQQAEDRKIIMELVQSQGKSNASPASVITKSEEVESALTDPKILMERFDWLLKDMQSRIKLLEGEISANDTLNSSISLKHSVKSLQRAEEKRCDWIGNKLSYLMVADRKRVDTEFNQLKELLFKCKVDALKLCEQEEQSKKAGGLPPGIEPPNFYGDSNTYSIWWESFNAIVHQNERESNFYIFKDLTCSIEYY